MMSKSPNMLRTRRRDINIKPNRRDTRLSRLDRKSSRGMIYENEELRLRTININAEIERGQYDIKKLKRENEMLKKEIWCLRDEYEKLDKLLKEKEIEFSSSSTTCTSDGSCTSDTESCSSCSSDDECELEGDEQSQNLENVQKTTNMQQQQQQQQQNYQQQHHHHHHYQHHEFDHLSVVVEENENSDKNSHTTTISPPPPPLLSPTTTTTTNNNNNNDNTIIKPDQSYPIYEKSNTLPITSIPTYQNSIINRKFSKSHDTIYPNQLYHDINDNNDNNIDNNWMNFNQIITKNNEIINKTTTDLIVKTDNRNFNNNFNDNNIDNNGNNNNTTSRSTFSNGGNLEELLNDIETISKDILQITNQQKNIDNNDNNFDNNIDNNEQQQQQQQQKPYKSELNVVLMPNPMPLLGFEKYEDLKKSLDNLQETEITENPFDFSDYFQQRYNPENFENQQQQQDKGSKTNLLELSTSDHCISSENDENCKIKTTNDKKQQQQQQQQPKLSIRRKVSIHFKGKKDKQLKTPTPTLEKKPSIFSLLTPSIDNKQQQQQQIKTPSIESRKSTTDNEPKTPTSSDSRLGSDIKKQLKQRKSISISPERSIVTTTNQTKQQHHDKKHKRHKKIDKNRQLNKRRDTISSIDNFNNIKLNRERSYSVCTDRSNIFPNNNNNNNNNYRERTNSLSSCDTIQNRKMSAISNLQINGKVPWCACWGNGCI